jgi:4-hydroxy-tetrahydrodipicolinate reductase
MIKLAITGACGRMGQRIVALAHESGNFVITGALEYSGHEKMGVDIGEIAGITSLGIAVSDLPSAAPEVMIDFTTPDSTEKWLAYCLDQKVAMVIGTTGLSDVQRRAIENAGEVIPIVLAANMSLGMNLLFKLAKEIAQTLDDSYDIEIDETHHRFKVDAPSGTAMELARQVATGKTWPFPDCLKHGREGNDPREDKTIGMHALRLGDTFGIHNVRFSCLGETVTLQHTAHSRDTFVRGALRAAQWVVSQRPGFYSMFDILGL